MPKGEDGKPTGDLSKLASAAAKEVAATGALDAFNKAKNSAEANQKNLVQAAVDAGTSIANNAAKDAAKTASTTPTAKTF